ncbi:MAG: acetate kinase, partial [Desulfitobacteriia bacterium]
MKVLVINCGSSSLKYQLMDMGTKNPIAKGLVERIGLPGAMLTHRPADGEKEIITAELPDHVAAIKLVLEAIVHPEYGVLKSLAEIDAVGHRVVHGGEKISESVFITEEVKQVITDCIELSPLHNPPNLTGIL